MGMKRSGKRLLNVGRKAARKLGKGGKAWVDKVFQTARQVIEDELEKSGKEAARGRSTAARPGRGAKASTGQAKATPTEPARRRGAKRPQATVKRRTVAAKRPPRRRARVCAPPIDREQPGGAGEQPAEASEQPAVAEPALPTPDSSEGAAAAAEPPIAP